nr:hypothetical protein ISGA_13770 [Gordonia sp. NB41Y]
MSRWSATNSTATHQFVSGREILRCRTQDLPFGGQFMLLAAQCRVLGLQPCDLGLDALLADHTGHAGGVRSGLERTGRVAAIGSSLATGAVTV